eukprot:4786088-Prymnesium_polylepis.1
MSPSLCSLYCSVAFTSCRCPTKALEIDDPPVPELLPPSARPYFDASSGASSRSRFRSLAASLIACTHDAGD